MVRALGIVTMREIASEVESGDHAASNALSTAGIVARSVQRSGSTMSARVGGSSGRSSGGRTFEATLARGAGVHPSATTIAMMTTTSGAIEAMEARPTMSERSRLRV